MSRQIAVCALGVVGAVLIGWVGAIAESWLFAIACFLLGVLVAEASKYEAERRR